MKVVQIFGEIVRAWIEVPRDSDHDGIVAGDLQIPEVVVDELGGRFHHNGADDNAVLVADGFLNLFINARDAMPRGGWLSIATRTRGDDTRSSRGSGGRGRHVGLRGIRRGRSWAVFFIPIRSALGGLRGCECVTDACKRGARHGGGAKELPARHSVDHRRIPSLIRWLWRIARRCIGPSAH